MYGKVICYQVHYTRPSVQDCTPVLRVRVSTVPRAGLCNRREMHNAHAQTNGLASVANVSALMLYPSNQTFSWENEVKRSGFSQLAKTNVYLYYLCSTAVQ